VTSGSVAVFIADEVGHDAQAAPAEFGFEPVPEPARTWAVSFVV
jgi:hypothetical protein